MKKGIIFIIAMTFMVSLMWGFVQVGTGTDVNQALPIEPFYGYSYSNVIYLSSEINTSGDITALQYQYQSTAGFGDPDDIVIYMGHTTQTSFVDGDDWIDVTTMTEVFNGALTFPPAAGGWMTIPLDTSFTYNGTENLVIAWDENTAGYHSSSDDFFCTPTNDVRGLIYRSDSTNPDPLAPPTASFQRNYLANVRFDGLTATNPPSAPTDPVPVDAAIDVNIDTNLEWNGMADTYYVYLWDDSDVMIVDGEATTDLFYDIPVNLAYSTLYHWRIDAQNAVGTTTGTEWTFTTRAAPAVFTLPFNESFDTDVLPADWLIDPVVAGDSWEFWDGAIGHGANGENTGNSGFYIGVDDSSPETVPAHLYTPQIDLTGAANPTLVFYYWIGDQAATGSTLNIDINDGTTTTADVAIFTDTVDHWELASVDLSPWAGQTIIVDFRAMESTSFYGDICLDDVDIFDAVNPPAVATNPVPADGAVDVNEETDLSWTGDPTTDTFYVSLWDDSDVIIIDNQPTTDTTYDIPILGFDTLYHWRIDSENANGLSTGTEWSFTTRTSPYIALPLNETFEDQLPAYLDYFTDIDSDVYWDSLANYVTDVAGGMVMTGNGSTNFTTPTATDVWTINPTHWAQTIGYFIGTGDTYLLEFDWNAFYQYNNFYTNMRVDVDYGSGWVQVGQNIYQPAGATTGWLHEAINLGPITGNFKVRFWTNVKYNFSGYTTGFHIDNFMINPVTTGDVEGYVYEYGTTNPIVNADVTIDAYTVQTDGTGYYTVTGLLPDTYDITASFGDYIPETHTIDIIGNTVATQDFGLMWAEIAVDPMAVDEYVEPDNTMPIDFTVTNNGNYDLTYNTGLNFISDNTHHTNYRGWKGEATSSPYAESTTGDTPRNIGNTDAIWDVQFAYDVDTPSGLTGIAGAETDGQFLYATKWNGAGEIVKFDLQGNYIETFTIPGVVNLRDLAYDGQYFYGSDASSYIWEMDFNTQTLISTITTPNSVRAIAYDPVNDGFWYNNFSSDLELVDRTGTVLNTIVAPPSMYGCAYDDLTAGGPYLWIFTGTSTGGGCQIEQYDLNTLTLTGVTHSVDGDLGAGAYIAGGLFLQPDLIGGTYTLGGLAQGTPDLIFGYELGVTETWLSITDPGPGVVVPGATETFTAQLDATGLANGDVKTGEILVNNNSLTGSPVTVPVTMNVGTEPTTVQLDPMATPYWTGSVDPTIGFTDDSEVRGLYTEDGWMMFDTSAIPAGATITNIQFNGYVNDCSWPYWDINDVFVDPLTSTPVDVFVDIQAGTYTAIQEGASAAPGWRQHDLGGNAIADLTAAMAQGWFAIGINSTDNSTSYYIEFDGWNEANPPYLVVTYETAAPPTPPDVLFSEYIEGSSNNKAIEIWNNTGADINLDNFRINQASNGGGWQYQHYFPAGATVADGDVWVIITDQTDPALFDPANADEVLGYPSVVHFNGNDARGLEWTNDGGTTWWLIDVIGDPDEDIYWDVAGVSEATHEYTLVRKDDVMTGNTNWPASAGTNATDSEWVVYPQNTFDYLGEHPSVPPVLDPPTNLFVDDMGYATWDTPGGGGGAQDIFFDDFESGLGNWTVENNGQPGGWLIYTDPYPNTYTLPAPAQGTSVCAADADENYPIDSELILVSDLDLTSFTEVILEFDNDFNAIDTDDWAYVDVSTDFGGTWTNVWGYNTDLRETHETVDITAEVAGSDGVLVRFYSVQPGWDWFWVIDNVYIHGIGGTDSKSSKSPVAKVGKIANKTENNRAFLEQYNVYLDGTLVGAAVTDLFFYYDDGTLVDGQSYLAEVTALYDEGESDPVDYTFVYDGGGVTLDPPQNLTVTDDGFADWDAPGGGGPAVEILHNTGYDNNGIGTAAAADFVCLARFDGAQLASYYDTHSLTEASIVVHSLDYNFLEIQVYEGGSMYAPGPIVYSADITAEPVTAGVAYNHVFTTPVPLVSGNDYYIGYEIHATGDHPAAVDAGPMVADYGAWMFFSGAWYQLTELGATLDFNWVISGFVSLGVDELAFHNAVNRQKVEISSTMPKLQSSGQLEAEYTSVMRRPAENTRAFLDQYNVYLDGTLVGAAVTDLFFDYDDGTLVDGQSYLAEVTALYDEGESDPVDYTFVYDGGGVTLDPPQNLTVTDGGFADWDAPGGGGPGGEVYWSDFESDDGGWIPSADWDPVGDWEWTDSYNIANYTGAFNPPDAAYSGTGMWGTIINGDYTNAGGYSFLSQTFDFSSVTDATMSFWYWGEMWGSWDYCELWVNGDVVFSVDDENPLWQYQEVDLSAYNGLSSVNIEFAFYATTVVNRAGMYIDDVLITGDGGGGGGATVQVDPQAVPYWTGTTDGATLTDDSMVAGWDTEDGWMNFDVSGIPDGSTITEIEFNGYVNDTSWPYWDLTGVAIDPLTAAPADLMAEIQTNIYNSFLETSAFAPGWKVDIVGGTANADLAAALANDWFCLGINSTDNSASYYLVFDGWNEANPPFLNVTYEGTDGKVATHTARLIRPNTENTRAFLDQYNVYLDGTLVAGAISDTEYDLDDGTLVVGQTYTVGVSALYDEGESAVIEETFTYAVSNPQIVVAPTEINETLDPDQIMDVDLTISNTGTGDLTFDISIIDTSDGPVDNSFKVHRSGISRNSEEAPRVTYATGAVDDLWDDLLIFDVDTPTGQVGLAGMGWDGTYFYAHKWSGSNQSFQFDAAGNYIGAITLPLTGCRDSAFDGDYLYGSPANSSVTCWEPATGTAVPANNINVAGQSVRAIAYDEVTNTFWSGNWGDNIVNWDRTGTILNSYAWAGSMYGMAFENCSEGSFLYAHSQDPGCNVYRLDAANNLNQLAMFDATSLGAAGAIAGGAAAMNDWDPTGMRTIAVLLQGSPDYIAVLELGAGDDPWISADPMNGVVPEGGSETVTVTLNATDLEDITKTAVLVIANNAGPDVTVPVTMIVNPGGPDPLDPPNNFAGEVQNFNDVLLTWEAPGGATEEIQHHSGYDNNGIGTGAAADFICAARFDDVELSSYYGGWEISGVNVFLHSMDFSYIGVQVYEGGSFGDPGTLVYEEDITSSVSAGVFTNHILTTPVPLVAGNEYWIAYDLSATGDHPAAVDMGPMVPDKGAWMYFSGAWDLLPNLGAGLDFNWVITGVVSQSDAVAGMGKTELIGATRNERVQNVRRVNYSGAPLEAAYNRSFRTRSTHAVVNNETSRDLLGFTLYRDGAEIGSVGAATYEFLDEGLDAGDYDYTIVANYDDGDSDPAGPVAITITLPAPTGVTANSNWPNILVQWSAPTDTRALESYNVYQDDVLVTNTTSTFHLHANVPEGTYIYNVAAVFTGGYEGDWSADVEVIHTEPGGNDPNLIPLVTSLEGNYPNPFNPTTTIAFGLNQDETVDLVIYNIKGEKVRTLVSGELEAGYHNILWNGKDDSGKQTSSGVYFYKMKAGTYQSTKKMILMK
ncbi:MAG: lamin tail domain-containing protein [Candidatus Cloacimonetes bacterium]|nr:lamin tail domain-containing protein [Candidatus Cloacimonadota bacterium]MCF7814297.1 lamin tail domain-containing protein [Candidatus Cloacimonadota bacterium]MCF7868874.1 lamin tail domain-containing protein [Candidatus Cloacimonadota bacterium]MCF7884338.1 lamin tail domain-containing protein [Candidatus Cloacimonadota bacterium]